MKFRRTIAGLLVLVSVFAFSAGMVLANTHESPQSPSAGNVSDLPSLISFIVGSINSIIGVIFALGVMWVVYLAFALIKAEGDKKDEARNSILYGLVGLFVMVSVWGLVNILVNTFGLSEDAVTPTQIEL